MQLFSLMRLLYPKQWLNPSVGVAAIVGAGATVYAANKSSKAASSATAAQQQATDAQKPLIDEQVAASKELRGWAKEDRERGIAWQTEDRNRYKTVFQPLEDNVVADAANYASNQRYAEESARAQGDTMAQYTLAAERLGRMPNVQSAGAATRLALASAAAGANAQTNASRQVRDTAWARKIDALSLGKGLSPNASTVLSAAQTGAQSANSAMSSASQGLTNAASAYGTMANQAYNRAGQQAQAVGGLVTGIYQGGKQAGWWGGGSTGTSSYTPGLGDPTYGQPNGRAYDFSENMQEYGI